MSSQIFIKQWCQKVQKISRQLRDNQLLRNTWVLYTVHFNNPCQPLFCDYIQVVRISPAYDKYVCTNETEPPALHQL